MLFYLMASEDDLIMSKGSKVKHIFSYLTVIACVITAEFIHSVSERDYHTLMSFRYIKFLYLPLLATKLSLFLMLCANLLFLFLSLNVLHVIRYSKKNFNRLRKKANFRPSTSSIRLTFPRWTHLLPSGKFQSSSRREWGTKASTWRLSQLC